MKYNGSPLIAINLSLIAAIGKNNELGIDNHLLWHLKEDMKFFRETTANKTIIMGRKTFESLPGLLKGRKHIILSSNKYYKVDGATIMHTKEEIIDYIKKTDEECFIIGGAKIYEEFLPYAENIYLTEIDAESLADVYFPNFDKNNFNKEILATNEEKGIKYQMCLYRKKV